MFGIFFFFFLVDVLLNVASLFVGVIANVSMMFGWFVDLSVNIAIIFVRIHDE